MSDNKNSTGLLPFTNYFGTSLNEAQGQIYNHWIDSVDSILGSFDYINGVTSQTVDQLSRAQGDTLDYFFNQQQLTPFFFSSEKTTTPRKEKRDRVALVTGGVGGIGSAICERLYEDGNHVIATYISLEKDKAIEWQKEYERKGMKLHIVECDVTNFTMCKRVASKLNKEFGHIDILVNCAGITRDAMLRKMDAKQWQMVLETNLNSVFNVTKSFLNGMIKRKHGRIINISSVNGQKGQFGQTNYSTAKAGMIGFSRSLALELADTGITVNTVCPGYVGTSMVEAIREDILEGIINTIPMRRLAKPSEIAASVSFLSQENSAYITGSEISVNGGLFTG